jgi:hypothetical protein
VQDGRANVVDDLRLESTGLEPLKVAGVRARQAAARRQFLEARAQLLGFQI